MRFQSRPCAISHSSLSEPPARSETVPGGRLIKGSDFCAVVLVQNWPASHGNLIFPLGVWQSLSSCQEWEGGTEGRKCHDGVRSSAPIGCTEALIDWDDLCPNEASDSTGYVFRLSLVLINPLISCSTIHKVFVVVFWVFFLHSSYQQWLTRFSPFLLWARRQCQCF